MVKIRNKKELYKDPKGVYSIDFYTALPSSEYEGRFACIEFSYTNNVRMTYFFGDGTYLGSRITTSDGVNYKPNRKSQPMPKDLAELVNQELIGHGLLEKFEREKAKPTGLKK